MPSCSVPLLAHVCLALACADMTVQLVYPAMLPGWQSTALQASLARQSAALRDLPCFLPFSIESVAVLA